MASSGTFGEHVTVTMSADLVAGIARVKRNRSRFIAEAVRHALNAAIAWSCSGPCSHPHSESLATAALGLADWADAMPEADSDLLDINAGTPLTWQVEVGWVTLETDGIQP